MAAPALGVVEVAFAGQPFVRAALGVLRQGQAAHTVQKGDRLILDLQALLSFLAGELEVDAQDLLLGQFADGLMDWLAPEG